LIRLGLAPGFGAAAGSLLALGWDRAGLSLAGSLALVPLTASALLGAVAAVAAARRRSASPVQS
jgi:hypothetical protein